MNHEAPNPLNHKLDEVFARYREACPDLEPSANFMPDLWARIDARRGWMWHARTYVRRLTLAAAAAGALAIGIEIGHEWNRQPLISQSYVDVLQDDAATEDFAYIPVVDQMGDR